VAPEEAARGRSFTPEQRLVLLDVWQRSDLPASDFSELAGVSPHSLYTWKKKFEAEGPAGLVGFKRGAPKGSRLPEPTKRAILLLKRAHPDWGRQRIHDEMVRAEGLEASPGAIGKVLEDAGFVVEEAETRPHAPPAKRFECSRPSQVWQTDLFTFLLRRQNRRVYLVAFMDDFSRFVVGHALAASASGAFVRDAFEAAVAKHGLPEEVLTDNGPQYVTWRGKSAFKKLLERRGVKHRVARPRRPQTLGKVERLWKTLWEELLREAVFKDLEDARARLKAWFDHYNFARCHQALGGLVPADRFFQAAPEVKQALAERVQDNALEIARGGAPRKPFYLAGRVGDQPISLHAEGDRVVLVREDGRREEVDLVATGWRERPLGEPEPARSLDKGVEALASALEEREETTRHEEALRTPEGSEDDGGEGEEEDAREAAHADEHDRGDGEHGGDEALGGDPGDALGAVESDGDERGAGHQREPLLPAGGAGAAGAGDGDGTAAAGPDADAGAGAGPAEGAERTTREGAASLPGAGSDGAAHDRACKERALEGRIDASSPAADAGEDGASHAQAQGEGDTRGGDDESAGGVSHAPNRPPGGVDRAREARPATHDATLREADEGESSHPEPRRT
jgi:transposase InsO family protein